MKALCNFFSCQELRAPLSHHVWRGRDATT